MDNRERDKFYSTTPSSADDDEYELEPPDPDILSSDERRGREAIEASQTAIDVDEIYREAERKRGDEILENWVRNFPSSFRFQIKHLLIATAVLAIALTLARFHVLGTTLWLI